MIRYAVIPLADAPEQLPAAPVKWNFKKGDVDYIGLEWGDGDKVPELTGWMTFEDAEDFSKWYEDGRH